MRWFILAIGLALSACGGGGGDTATVSNTPIESTVNNPVNSVVKPSSTPLITSYMSTAYSNETTLYNADMKALERQLSAAGRSMSTYGDNLRAQTLESHIQNFINISLSYIDSTVSGYTLNKQEIKDLFTLYQANTSTINTANVISMYATAAIHIDSL